MNLNKLKNLYSLSPVWLKKLYSYVPFSIRNGKEYRTWRGMLSEDCNTINRTRETIIYAIENFDFYKRHFRGINIEKWEGIPLLSKSDIQQNIVDFEINSINKFYVTTGGVTGKPSTFYQSNNVWKKELAFVYNYFEKHGYKAKMVKASFRGGDFSNIKRGQVWKSNPIYNEMHFSPFHMNCDSIATYVAELNKYKPQFFHGYPSALLTLATLMKKNGLRLNYQPKVFFLISENYDSKDIDFLKNFFGVKVSSFYGHSERLVFAIANEDLKSYIPNLKYGYMELVDDKGNVIKENEKIGEIVGTSYDNYAMPLIRFKTGDYTYYVDYETKTFAQIQGKWGQDSLIGKSGEKITLTALNLHSPELSSFMRTQFHQLEDGVVEILVISSKILTKKEIIKIEDFLSRRVGELISFRIKIVDKLYQNSRGKTPLIIKK